MISSLNLSMTILSHLQTNVCPARKEDLDGPNFYYFVSHRLRRHETALSFPGSSPENEN